jgi:hypothetical protein
MLFSTLVVTRIIRFFRIFLLNFHQMSDPERAITEAKEPLSQLSLAVVTLESLAMAMNVTTIHSHFSRDDRI